MQHAIIADSSCLILLSKINELNILQLLFGEIIITKEIQQEFNKPLPDWVIIRSADDERVQKILESSLDKGESSAIALAVELENSLLILDDKKARNMAAQLHLDYTGTVGIIIDAKQNGYITSVKEVLHKIHQTDFRLSIDLENILLKLSGE